MTLHDDTLLFLEQRNRLRTQLASALQSGANADSEEDTTESASSSINAANFFSPPSPQTSTALVDNEEGGGEVGGGLEEDNCTVEGREDACNPFPALGAVEKFECQVNDEAGEDADKAYPAATTLYEDLNTALTDPDDENAVASKWIPLMRQANVLESYRKMLLHKKQGIGQYMRAWCACMANEPQSQDELERLMLGQSIGRTVPEDLGEEEDG